MSYKYGELRDKIRDARLAFSDYHGQNSILVPPSHITRGLEKASLGRNETYTSVFETFHGRNLLQHIQEAVNRNPDREVVIVDIGYGYGDFLEDVKTRWGERVKVVGIGSDVFLGDRFSRQISPNAHRADNGYSRKNDLLEQGIKLIDGNVIDAHKIIIRDLIRNGVHPDFIVASNVLQHSGYPPSIIAKRLYRVLAPDGILMLSYIYTTLQSGAEVSNGHYVKYWTDAGFDAEFSNGCLKIRKDRNPKQNPRVPDRFDQVIDPKLAKRFGYLDA